MEKKTLFALIHQLPLAVMDHTSFIFGFYSKKYFENVQEIFLVRKNKGKMSIVLSCSTD